MIPPVFSPLLSLIVSLVLGSVALPARAVSRPLLRCVFGMGFIFFSGALSYFGEDPELTPQGFFTTLHSFIKVRCVQYHTNVERVGLRLATKQALFFFFFKSCIRYYIFHRKKHVHSVFVVVRERRCIFDRVR